MGDICAYNLAEPAPCLPPAAPSPPHLVQVPVLGRSPVHHTVRLTLLTHALENLGAGGGEAQGEGESNS